MRADEAGDVGGANTAGAEQRWGAEPIDGDAMIAAVAAAMRRHRYRRTLSNQVADEMESDALVTLVHAVRCIGPASGLGEFLNGEAARAVDLHMKRLRRSRERDSRRPSRRINQGGEPEAPRQSGKIDRVVRLHAGVGDGRESPYRLRLASLLRSLPRMERRVLYYSKLRAQPLSDGELRARIGICYRSVRRHAQKILARLRRGGDDYLT